VIKRLTLLTLVALLVAPAFSNAKDMTGKYGLGYFTTDAPIGFRYWATPKLGIDVGVGFKSDAAWVGEYDETEDRTVYSKETASSFWFEVGFPYVVVATDQVNFWVRPGFQFASLDDRIFSPDSKVYDADDDFEEQGMDDVGLDAKFTQMTISLTPAAEWFISDNFSIEAGHGIKIQMLKFPDDKIPGSDPAEYYYGDAGGETETSIVTFSADNVFFAFHFYFK